MRSETETHSVHSGHGQTGARRRAEPWKGPSYRGSP
jgi:hypothetical protein